MKSVVSLSFLVLGLAACSKKEALFKDKGVQTVQTAEALPQPVPQPPQPQGNATPPASPPAPSTATAETTQTVSTASEKKLHNTRLTATVVGLHTSQLVFQTSGYLEQIFIVNGSLVKKGQLLAKLSDAMQKQDLEAKKTALDQAKNNAFFAKKTYDRNKALFERGATTAVNWEQAESSYNDAVLSVKQAEANLNISKINLSYTRLEAPYDGVVFNVNAWVGNYVSSTSPLMTLTSTQGEQLLLSVPPTLNKAFQVGDKLPFSSTKGVKGTFVVTSVVPYIEDTTKTYTVVGKAEDLAEHQALLAGETLIVDITP